MVERTESLAFVILLATSLFAGLSGRGAGEPATPPAPAQGNPLNLAILWHMHQPLYKNVLTGLYEMPWVRDHTDTEYLDHPKILMQYPSVNVTFNLVPSLIYQIEDYANTTNPAIDNHIQLARIDLGTATPDQRRTIAQEFIRLAPWYYTNYTSDGNVSNPWYYTYAAFPRLHDLVQKVSADPLSLNDTELQDLETIYFLRQISIPYIRGDYDPAEKNDTILTLLNKGTRYNQTDTETVLAIQRDIMGKVVGFYKEAQDLGQAEVITTAYYHPITPLLMAKNVTSEDGAHNVSKGVWADDTRYQYQNASDFYLKRFGHRSAGVWSAEQAVSPDIIPYAVDAGFNWTSSDEHVLWDNESTVGGHAVGNSVVNLTKVYNVTVSGRTMDIVFRNTDISNQVSFTYGGMPTDQAVSDFMSRLQGFHNNLTDAQRKDALVTLAADGENWMFMAGYPNDGRDFLNRLYENLTAAQNAGWLKTWKIGDFVSQPGRVKTTLSTLHAGSWVDANFRTWSGEEEEQVAWARLMAARQAVITFTNTTEGRSFVDPSSSAAVKKAWEAIFAAEGSDWFWWYGDDQSSGDDGKFDMMFKAHLITAYRTIGVTPPIDITTVWGANATPTQPGAVTETSPPPTIDGTAGTTEWANATGWTKAASGDLLYLRGFYAFADASTLYLRVDLNGNATILRGTSGRDVDIYLSYPIRTAERDMEANLNRYGVNFATKNSGYAFNWAARYRVHPVFSQSLSDGTTPWSLFTAEEGPTYLGDGGWTYVTGKESGVALGSVIEFIVPLSTLAMGPGDLIRLAVVSSNGTSDVDMLPGVLDGPGQISVLVPAPAPPIAIFQDPIGDDVGDGDYTYATSSDFHYSNGSYTPGLLYAADSLYDLTYFNISDAPTSMTFTFGFVDIGMNFWGGPNGFSYQIVEVYMDTDRVPGSGHLRMRDGPNAEVTPDFAWEVMAQAAGWNSEGRTFVAKDPSSTAPIYQSGVVARRVPGTNNIQLTIPKALLPAGDVKSWGYVVVAGGQDGYGTGKWRAVAASASTWVFGGGGRPGVPPAFNSKIFDAITAPGVSQTAALASYTASTLAQVPGVIIEVKAPEMPVVSVSPAAPWPKGQVVTANWTASPNSETQRAIESYDVSVFYSATDTLVSFTATPLNETIFTVTKELNITIRVTAYDGLATSAPFIGIYEVLKSPPPPPVNHAPVLTNATLEPGQGDERTVFLFSVRYVDVDGNAPNVSLLMDGTPTAMAYVGGDNSTGAVFRTTLTLPAGDHAYKFRADDRKGAANSIVETEEFHLTVASAGGIPTVLVAGIGVGVAAVIGVAVYLMWRSRRPPKTTAAEEKPAEKPREESETEKGGGV